MRQLVFTLRAAGVIQFFFGALFVFAPPSAPGMLHLAGGEPHWVTWLFVMMGARFLGYGVGMFVAARDPQHNLTWINTMIVIQVIDWVGTVWALTLGGLGLRNVTTAIVLPLAIVAALVWWHPRRQRNAAAGDARR